MYKKLIAGFTSILLFIQASAQTPDMYPPPDPEPVDPTTLNIVLFIIMPIILIIVFFLYRRSIKKKREKRN